MARISASLVVQFVDGDRAVLVDDRTGLEEVFDLDMDTIRDLLDVTPGDPIELGGITVPPDSVTKFVFYVGYFYYAASA